MILLSGAGPSRGRVRTLARWTRALVPAFVLVTSSGEAPPREPNEERIELEAERVASGPLSLADALVRAANASRDREG